MEAVHSNSDLLADVARYEWVPIFSMDLGVGSPRPACESLSHSGYLDTVLGHASSS